MNMIERFLQWREYRRQLARSKWRRRHQRALDRLWKDGYR